MQVVARWSSSGSELFTNVRCRCSFRSLLGSVNVIALVSVGYAVTSIALARIGHNVTLISMSVALQDGLLLAVRHDSAHQIIDQALMDLLNVVTSRISAAPKSRADTVYDIAIGDILWDDLAAHLDGVDELGCELHMF